MTPQEQLEQAAKEYKAPLGPSPFSSRSYQSFMDGGLKGMEIQKEIDRVQIHTLREALYGAVHQLRQYAHRDEDYRRAIEKYMKILEP